MSPARVIVVQHTETGGPKRLGEWLEADGLDLETIPAFDGRPLPSALGHDALVVLGGGYMPDDDARAPWLPRTRSLVRQALALRRPVLGICLGGQLLAHVAGGQVRADSGVPERGSTAIHLRDEADNDPLFGDLPPVVPVIENHVDAITELPPAASWLATSDDVPYQAFRLGSAAWGVQFHPEAPADSVLRWDTEELRQQGFDQQELYKQALADESRSAEIWRSVAHRFAMLVQVRRGLTDH